MIKFLGITFIILVLLVGSTGAVKVSLNQINWTQTMTSDILMGGRTITNLYNMPSGPADASINCNASYVWVEARNGTKMFIAAKGATGDTATFKYALETGYRGRSVAVVSIGSTYYINDQINQTWGTFDGGNQILQCSQGAGKDAIRVSGGGAITRNLFLVGNGLGNGVHFDAANCYKQNYSWGASHDGNVYIFSNAENILSSGFDKAIVIGPDPGDFENSQMSDTMFSNLRGTSSRIGVVIQGHESFNLNFRELAAWGCTEASIWVRDGTGVIYGLSPGSAEVYIKWGDNNTSYGPGSWYISYVSVECGETNSRFFVSYPNTTRNDYTQLTFNGGHITTFSNTQNRIFTWNHTGDLVLKDMDIASSTLAPQIYMGANASTGQTSHVILENIQDYSSVNWNRQLQVNASSNNTEYTLKNLKFYGAPGNTNDIWMLSDGRSENIDSDNEQKIIDYVIGLGGCTGIWSPKYASSGVMRNGIRGNVVLKSTTIPWSTNLWWNRGISGYGGANDGSEFTATSSQLNVSGNFTLGTITCAVASSGIYSPIVFNGGYIAYYINGADRKFLFSPGADNMYASGFTDNDTGDNIFRAHLVIGRYTSGQNTSVDTVNLWSGAKKCEFWASGIKTWNNLPGTNTLTISPWSYKRSGLTFLFKRQLTDAEVQGIQDYAYALASR